MAVGAKENCNSTDGLKTAVQIQTFGDWYGPKSKQPYWTLVHDTGQ